MEQNDFEDLSGLDRGDAFGETDEAPVAEATPSLAEQIEAQAPAEPEPEPEQEQEAEPEAEPEQQAEPEAEPEQAAEPESEPEELRPDHKIPKQRFDEINGRRKAAEARAQQLQAEIDRLRNPEGDGEPFDFDAKEREHMEAVVDGRFDEAMALRAEIRKAEQAEYMRTAEKLRAEAVQQSQVEANFARTVAELEAQYPELDYRLEGRFNKEAVDEIGRLHSAFMSAGYYTDPSDSLREATAKVVRLFGIGDQASAAPTPPEAPKEAPKPRQRAVTDTERKAAAAAAQPRMPSSGQPGTPREKAVDELTEEEFAALPEARKAELRGDIFG